MTEDKKTPAKDERKKNAERRLTMDYPVKVTREPETKENP